MVRVLGSSGPPFGFSFFDPPLLAFLLPIDSFFVFEPDTYPFVMFIIYSFLLDPVDDVC